jgi:mono/diheme cytochrome c family protein
MRWQGILGMATAMAGALAFSGCGDEPLAPRTLPGSGLAKAAPAISGGTLVKIEPSLFAAADPDTDQIHFVHFGAEESVESIDLELGDEPGRLAVGAGKVYAALRGGGALVSIDVASHAMKRLAVCPAPRGVLFDAGLVHVACATGELVTVDENLEGVVRQIGIDRDLRDVVRLADGSLGVSVFRSAELIVVHPSGAMMGRQKASDANLENTFTPSVAWRSIPMEGGVLMLHQRGTVANVGIEPQPGAPPQSSPYGGAADFGPTCSASGILHAGATLFDPQGTAVNAGFVLGPIVLPVDVATEGALYAVVGAGSNVVVTGTRGQLDVTEGDFHFPTFPCPQLDGIAVTGEPVAVAFADASTLVVQRRQPAGLARINRNDRVVISEVAFGGPSRRQVGHMFFHQAASPTSGIACASCHPEGREDGRVWTFEQLGPRRTQTVAGGVLDTAPLHWDGDFNELDGLMRDVFVRRMGGASPSDLQLAELADWMQTLPHLPSRALGNVDAVARGKALYHDAKVGCASCHGGDKLTNHLTVAVGTGKAFQVPSLVGIGDRAPFMHDGCAPTLADRFDPYCGGGDQHGVTSHLSESQLSDLVIYLETL